LRQSHVHAIHRRRFDREACRYQVINQSTISSSSSNQDLNVELVKIYDMNNVKLTLNGTCLYTKPTTVLFLFELEQCVEHVFYELSQYTHDVRNSLRNSNIL